MTEEALTNVFASLRALSEVIAERMSSRTSA